MKIKKKIVIFTGDLDKYKLDDRMILEISKNKNIDLNIINYMDIYYDNGEYKYIKDSKALPEFDLYWIIGKNGIDMKNSLSYYYIIQKKCKNIDKVEYRLQTSKIVQMIFAHFYNIRTPKTLFFLVIKNHIQKYIEIIEKKFEYPFILKRLNMGRGEGVLLVDSRETLLEYLEMYENSGLIFQEFLKNDGDYRINVIGDKMIGVIKRYNHSDYRNNISQGGKGKKSKIDKELENMSIKITKDYGLGVAGLDFFIINGEPILIEINSVPQYGGFETYTGVNYLEELFKYFEKN